MPTRSFNIYEVDNVYPVDGTGPGGADPVVLDILVMEVVDNNNRLQADPGSAGTGQVISIDGTQVNDFDFLWDDNITINGTAVSVKTFTLTINGTQRSFIMSEDENNISGASVGDSFVLDSYSNYSQLRYNRVACFLRGTMIKTENGERPIETLLTGDKIFTLDHGFQAIDWIGSTVLSRRTLIDAPHLRPVLIPAGSIGENLPTRDLRVSPQHRILLSGSRIQLFFGLEEALAPAISLIGRNSISVVEDCKPVEYFHMMFRQHEIIESEGLPSESFLVGEAIKSDMDHAHLAEILDIFPELESQVAHPALYPARPILKRYEVSILDQLAA